jgi:hypothetical protein
MLTTSIITKIAEETRASTFSFDIRSSVSLYWSRHSPHALVVIVVCSLSLQSVDTSNPSASVWVPGGGLNLICSSLSPNGSYIACSDPIQVKLYRVQHKEGSINPNALLVNKIKVNQIINPASSLVFSAVSRQHHTHTHQSLSLHSPHVLPLMNKIIFATLESLRGC